MKSEPTILECSNQTAKPFGRRNRAGLIAFLCLSLIAITLAVYMQVGNHQFLNFDDGDYVAYNPHIVSGITGENITWTFTSVYAANWHPLTWLSHMLDVQLFGLDPRGHHLINVAIHIINTLLLFLLLVRLTGAVWRGWFVAALFALHPLHVESVAWVAERKDVLSGMFFFITLLLYAEYAANQRRSLYLLTLVTFMFGLMAKPMLVTLPIIMLLLDYWPLHHVAQIGGCALRQLFVEKIPFLVCSMLSGIVTIYAQQKGGSVSDTSVVPMLLRIENALTAYVLYLGKTFWPVDLTIYYPFPSSIPLWQPVCSLALLIAVTGAAIRARQNHPHLLVGWFWFLVSLVPVIGLLNVGGQAMADRYTYLPLCGIFIMIAWGIPCFREIYPFQRSMVVLLATSAIVVSLVLTWRQLRHWEDNFTLYRHTLQVTRNNYLIHNNLGVALTDTGQLNAAVREYQAALRIIPYYSDAHYNLGSALQQMGYLDDAIIEYWEALRFNSGNTDAHINLGQIFAFRGDLDAAILEYRRCLQKNRNKPEAHFGLAGAMAAKGLMEEAIHEYQETLRLEPQHAKARKNLEDAKIQMERVGQSK